MTLTFACAFEPIKYPDDMLVMVSQTPTANSLAAYRMLHLSFKLEDLVVVGLVFHAGLSRLHNQFLHFPRKVQSRRAHLGHDFDCAFCSLARVVSAVPVRFSSGQ